MAKGNSGRRGAQNRNGGNRATRPSRPPEAKSYRHTEAESLLRPDVGTQAQFRKKKPPQRYRYDSSLSPALEWDGQNAARDFGEWLIVQIREASRLTPPHTFDRPRDFKASDGTMLASVRGLDDAVDQLARLGRPFLNWAGKAERLSFDVPTLPLFVHERLSTKAILETVKSHKRDPQKTMFDLFGDPELPIHDQVLRAYEHKGGWTNRLILGDSLVVMNSLLQYEGLGGQVQMIYMDPPYGVKFGSNFQPFVRRRDVKHGEDEDMSREPEVVKAYRDTWELGLHSYLTYLRDRLALARELLAPSGSILVQIGEENLHRVRDLLDEVFGETNSCAVIPFAKTASTATKLLSGEFDYLLWYAREISAVRYHQVYAPKALGTFRSYKHLELPNGGGVRSLTKEEIGNPSSIPQGCRVFQISNLASQEPGPADQRKYRFEGREYDCGPGKHWKTRNPEGLDRLVAARRMIALGSQLNYKRYLDDFPFVAISNLWADTGSAGYSIADPKRYVVQTDSTVLERCLLMTTSPGDLVLDPTCGSGTTAYVAEQWGRRWITIDTSRVPLALARQRLLTATFPYYQLKQDERGPAGGFDYVRRQNSKGDEVGGIVPHVTLQSIANDEPPKQEILVDRPEEERKITRVTGPFCVEATIPTPLDWEERDPSHAVGEAGEAEATFPERMLEILRKSPVLHLPGGKSVTFRNLRFPAKTLSLSAEAAVDVTAVGQSPSLPEVFQEASEKSGERLPLSGKPVAIVFGPENGAVSEKLAYEAAKEAGAKNYTHLYVIGFAIQPNARKLVEECDRGMGIPATYVQATPDIMMGDLLKNMRSSQIFSVCGLPEVRLRKAKGEKGAAVHYQVDLLGLDVFDPGTMEVDHRTGDDVPAWFLDTDYNGLVFRVGQAFFPRTSAWEGLRKALKGEYDDSVWEHLAGTTSTPFEAGEHGQVAVKVIDDRGNELLVVKALKDAQG